MTTSIKQNYADDKGDEKKMKLYDKMIGIVGTEYKLLAAVEIVDGEANESPFIVPLLKETRRLHN